MRNHVEIAGPFAGYAEMKQLPNGREFLNFTVNVDDPITNRPARYLVSYFKHDADGLQDSLTPESTVEASGFLRQLGGSQVIIVAETVTVQEGNSGAARVVYDGEVVVPVSTRPRSVAAAPVSRPSGVGSQQHYSPGASIRGGRGGEWIAGGNYDLGCEWVFNEDAEGLGSGF